MNIHLIAIGGTIMHDLAISLQKNGHHITGSDDIIYEPSKSKLEKAGLSIKKLGWDASRITTNIDMVILGMHAQIDNPELIQAQKLDIPIFSFPEFIYQQSKHQTRVVIAGSHGKTTVTAMILHVLRKIGKSVGYLVGATTEEFEHNICLDPQADFMILEGDEYLSSRLDSTPKMIHYKPNIALINGIAWDHMNVFETTELYTEAFINFCQSISDGGILIYNKEDNTILEIIEKLNNKYIKKFPFETPPYHYYDNQTILETSLGQVTLKIFGKHNLRNIQAALSVCLQLNIDEEQFYDAIASFEGASKRLQILYESAQLIAFKDFAHAPSKVLATVEAIKERFPNKKIISLTEIHTYSSLNKDFLPQYKNTLQGSNEALVYFEPKNLTIKRLPAIENSFIQECFNIPKLTIANNSKDIISFLKKVVGPNCVVLCMSSGTFGGTDIINTLKKIDINC